MEEKHLPLHVPFILKGKYFKISKHLNGSVEAECQLCPERRSYKGSFKATTNFREHLKRKHGNSFLAFLKEEEGNPKSKRGRTASIPQSQDGITSYVRRDEARTISSNDKLILNFVVKGMHPLAIVNQPEFRTLINGIKREAPVPVMGNDKLLSLIEARFSEFQNSERSKMAKVDYICLTTDLWTCKGMTRSFLGMTAHWIDKDNFSRISSAIACRRFRGKHTHDRLHRAISIIMNEYNLKDNVVKIVTDNAGNFTKAFTLFDKQEEDGSDFDSDDDLDAEFNNVGSQLSECTQQVSQKLPPHQKCASHTLSLICTSDLKSFKSRLQRSSFAKCTSIWNKISRSTQASEKVKDLIGKSLSTPVCTRWNSLYNSVVDLLNFRQLLVEICTATSTTSFNENEVEFLSNYCACVRPIAEALNKMQGENMTYFGCLLPTLIATNAKLTALCDRELDHVGNLPNLLLAGLQKRFGPYLALDSAINDSIIAAVSHPRFKLRWVPEKQTDYVKDLFLKNSVKNSASCVKTTATTKPVSSLKSAEDDEFFMLKSTVTDKVIDETDDLAVKAQCLKYLSDEDTELQSLLNYHFVKEVFLKYNTPLPSSAPVERLFNYANMILRPNRRNLTDTNFEMMTLLKVNNFV